MPAPQRHAEAHADRSPPGAAALIGLGSNLGDRRMNLLMALDALRAAEGVEIARVSSLHETVAVGPRGPDHAAPRFLNAAAEVRTPGSARELLSLLLAVERALGRERSSEKRWGPRLIDLDLLLFGDAVIDEPGGDGGSPLTVPHPRMHQRRFVLEPLAEIAGEAAHPTLGLTVAQMLASLKEGE